MLFVLFSREMTKPGGMACPAYHTEKIPAGTARARAPGSQSGSAAPRPSRIMPND